MLCQVPRKTSSCQPVFVSQGGIPVVLLQRVVFAVGLVLTLGALGFPAAAQAQPAGNAYRIGVFSSVADDPALEAAFFDALRNLGYVATKNLIVERRYIDSRPNRQPSSRRKSRSSSQRSSSSSST
jgi:hypothetical protein